MALPYALVLLVITWRVANMWAADAAAPAWIRRWFARSAFPLRAGLTLAGGYLAWFSYRAGAFGHAFLNGFLALLALVDADGRTPVLGRLALLVGAPATRLALLLGCAFLPWLGVGVPESLNVLGAGLLVSAFSAMMTGQWGAASAGSRRYADLCLAGDAALFASAVSLGIGPLIALETFALAVDLHRWLALRRAPGAEAP